MNDTAAVIDRQNILNNTPALRYVESYLAIPSWKIGDETKFTLKQVAEYYDVDIRTIERYLEQHGEELKENWYSVLTGELLSQAKNAPGTDIYVGPKTTVLWVFSFRAFLNIGMILTESERAKDLRTIVLDIVMNYIAERGGGNSKYINQNDDNFILTYKDSLYYRNKFTWALNQYVIGWPNKYPYFTNMVYEEIFMEHANEYKILMKLGKKDNIRHTLYSEVLNLVSAFENGFAAELEKHWPCDFLKAKELFNQFKKAPLLEPLIQNARILMASRDKALRDIIHEGRTRYSQTLSHHEYDIVCREDAENKEKKSQEFVSIMDENIDVLLRLKNK